MESAVRRSPLGVEGWSFGGRSALLLRGGAGPLVLCIRMSGKCH